MLYTSRLARLFLLASSFQNSAFAVSELYCQHWVNLYEQGDGPGNGCCTKEVIDYSSTCRANAKLYQDLCECSQNLGQTIIDDTVYTDRLSAFAGIYNEVFETEREFIFRLMKTIYYGTDFHTKLTSSYWENNVATILQPSNEPPPVGRGHTKAQIDKRTQHWVKEWSLNPPDETTRWIPDRNQDFLLTRMHHHSFGFEYMSFTHEGAAYIQVTRIVPGSKTHSDGVLRRGHIISAVGGESLPLENTEEWFSQKMEGASTAVLTAWEYDGGFTNQQAVTVTASDFKEDALQVKKVISHNGKKYGYLMLNFFEQDSQELELIFKEMKSEQIDEIIIDLRINNGGFASSTLRMGGMLSPSANEKLAVVIKSNTEVKQFYDLDLMPEIERRTFFNYTFGSQINQTALPENSKFDSLANIHVITSPATAGAAEMLIMGLQQYTNVHIVGEKSKGDFYISSVYDYSKSNSSLEIVTGIFQQAVVSSNPNFRQNINWAHQNDCGALCVDSGFKPNLEVMDHHSWSDMKDFGDENEIMLHAVLNGAQGASDRRRKLSVNDHHVTKNRHRSLKIQRGITM